MEDIRIETTLDERPGRFQWCDWPFMEDDIEMPTIYSISEPNTRQKGQWWAYGLDRVLNAMFHRMQMRLAIISREDMYERIKKENRINRNGIKIEKLDANEVLVLFRKRWEENESFKNEEMWVYDAEFVVRMTNVAPLFELHKEDWGTVQMDVTRRYFLEYPWVKEERPTLYSFLKVDPFINKMESRGNTGAERMEVIRREYEKREKEKREKEDTERQWEELREKKQREERSKEVKETPNRRSRDGGKERIALGGGLTMKKGRKAVMSDKKVFENEDNKNTMTIRKEKRQEKTTGKKVKEGVKRIPFCTTQLFNMGDHYPITLETIGDKWTNADRLKRHLLGMSQIISQIMTITSSNVDDASEMTEEQLETADPGTREAWRQFERN
jgi:hypothetical protein